MSNIDPVRLDTIKHTDSLECGTDDRTKADLNDLLEFFKNDIDFSGVLFESIGSDAWSPEVDEYAPEYIFDALANKDDEKLGKFFRTHAMPYIVSYISNHTSFTRHYKVDEQELIKEAR